MISYLTLELVQLTSLCIEDIEVLPVCLYSQNQASD